MYHNIVIHVKTSMEKLKISSQFSSPACPLRRASPASSPPFSRNLIIIMIFYRFHLDFAPLSAYTEEKISIGRDMDEGKVQ
jgi:hypothetical protein